jgi:hypothetical protein
MGGPGGVGGGSLVPKMPSFAMVAGAGFAQRTQVADVNGDGKLDALFWNDTWTTLQIAPGNGDGTFRAPVSIPVKADAWSFAAGDLDGDGKVDLAVAHSTGPSGFVSVLSNLGNLTFAPAAEFPAVTVAKVQLADFDGDGRLDIAAAGARSLCSILINKGGGMFAPSGDCTFPTTNSRIRLTTMLASGDLTGDGKVDLAAIFTDFRAVSILANKGDGSFLPGADLPATAGFGLQGTLALADLDGDGRPEIVVGGDTDHLSSLAVFPNLGAGNFGPAVLYAGTRVVGGGNTILVGDLNGDGHVDIVTYHHMFLNRGDGTLMVVDPPPWQTASAMGDVNGDGKPDLLVEGGVLINTTPN